MDELIIKYINYIVEHQLRNDAGVTTVRDSMQGNLGKWMLAVRRYVQIMGATDATYATFRRRWAWDKSKVQEILASPEGRSLSGHIRTVAQNFHGQAGMKDFTLGTADLNRDLNTQIDLYTSNWSVVKLAPKLMSLMKTHMTAQEKKKTPYPDPPTEEAATKFANYLTSVGLPTVSKVNEKGETVTTDKPTSASPGLSDHGRLSAVDFVVYKKGAKLLGADSGDRTGWRTAEGTQTFEGHLQSAINTLNNNSASTIFEGPLADPDEPWHYTYVPIRNANHDD